MNGMIYYEPVENNIFEERFRQFRQMKKTIKVMLKDMDYRFLKKDYYNSDPTNPTYCHEWIINRSHLYPEEEENKKILVPDIDRNVAFVSGGNRWIPVFQISDIPFFKKDDKIILHNTYVTLVLDTDLKYFKIDGKNWPLFLLLLDSEKSIEKVMDKLKIVYSYENEEIDNNINIPCYDSTYISFKLKDTDIKLQKLFKPFYSDSVYYKRFKRNIFEYLNEEEAVGNYCLSWNDENKLENIISLNSLKDYGMVPNGFFSDPFTMLDLIYFIFKSNSLKIEDREINDISKRRIRLSEWLLYKFTQQHKNNVLKKINKFYEKSILDVLNTDQRRILDDNVNSLGELSMMSRIIYNGPGGIAKESANSKLRNLHDSYYGLISPADTPSGESVGISQHIIPEARLEKGKLVNGNNQEKDLHILSVSEQQIPFLNKNDCTRIEMSCNQMRQAISLEEPEVPLIKSGYESTYTKYSSYIIKAKENGMCVYKDDNLMFIEYDIDKQYFEEDLENIDIETEDYDDVIDLRYNSYLGFDRTIYTKLNEGDRFKKDDVIACCKSINPETGELMLGKNLLVGFLSYGWNFEDSIIISESAAKKLSYRQVYHDRLEINDEILLSLEDDNFNPIRKNGSFIEEGDVLFKINISDNDNISSLLPCYREILSPISGQFYSDIKIRKTNTNSLLMNKWLKALDDIHVQIENKKLDIFGSSNNYKKYKNKYCYKHNTRKINAKTCTIDYSIINTKPTIVGSKIANRHGNKGVISIIIPDDEMPKLPDGTPLEVILNPLGVISRMNIGQLFEIHVTSAMSNFINKIKNNNTENFLEKCIEFISIIDNTKNKEYTIKVREFIKNMNTNQKMNLVENIKNNGMQIIQPPFESCTYQQLDELMKFTETPYTEKVTLNNGMKVDCAVGLMYMMRLQHEPDHKIFARSVGVYGKHEQAPSGTDAHRFGEMEVWSLLAYEAYDTIKEFMSIKADNPEERYRHFTYLYEGQEDLYEPHNFETITHETFKTYLKGCGLKVTF